MGLTTLYKTVQVQLGWVNASECQETCTRLKQSFIHVDGEVNWQWLDGVGREIGTQT